VLFNSVEYLLFLPIVFAVYWAIGYARINDSLKLRLQNAFVVIASYVFYGWWDWRFLILIAFTSLCSYASGLLIHRTPYTIHHTPMPKLWLWLNIAINIGILAVFKYYDFFVTEFITTFFPESLQPSLINSFTLKIILPVGISFYTFQALSYSIDVYRGNIKPTRDIIAFFAFISFFPQLVAGPIERATNLLPQFLQKRTFSYEQGVDGMRQILWGLFKKIVVADNCAMYMDQVWASYDTQSGSTLLLAAILFSFQIYGDFSGYSDIAIGTAKLFGITLMRNFNNPYFSRDVAEFWRRWHISLTSWFRDYVYIPLGGSRPNVVYSVWCTVEGKKKLIVVRNVMIVFLICGLWHGANWTYLVWGLYNVLLFLPLILLGKSKRYKDSPLVWKQLPQMLLTFVLVTIGWIIFRAPSVTDAWDVVCNICSGTLWSAPYVLPMQEMLFMAIGILVMIGVEWLQRNEAHGLALNSTNSRALRYAIYIVLITMILWKGDSGDAFIYFQF
jgi:D-alanyl-lipoteichoic acid acyltransferase DltB (MBOAT superfamily)